jgi:hypothetical protein
MRNMIQTRQSSCYAFLCSLLFTILLLLGLPNLAIAEICGAPPPDQFREENNESIKGDLAGKANFLSSFVGKSELGGKIELTRKEIFSKYSDANTAYMDRYLAYMFCLVLFDPKNTQKSEDKINAIHEFRRQQQKPQSSIPKEANVVFVAGRPASPVFWLFNEGEAAAERPKYGFVICDIDAGNMEQPCPLLEIPFQLFNDYILPKRALGPWRILELSERAREVPLGHNVFGYVTVQCFNCARPRTYWLHFTNGQSGWFREASESETSVIGDTLAKVISGKERASEIIDRLVPLANRVPFK